MHLRRVRRRLRPLRSGPRGCCDLVHRGGDDLAIAAGPGDLYFNRILVIPESEVKYHLALIALTGR